MINVLRVVLACCGGLSAPVFRVMERPYTPPPSLIAQSFAGWGGDQKGLLPAYGRALAYHPGTRQRQRRRDRRRAGR